MPFFPGRQPSVFLSDLASEPGLIKGPVGRNEHGVAQERHRQLGCYGDLKTHSRGKEYYRSKKEKCSVPFLFHVPAARPLWRQIWWRSSERRAASGRSPREQESWPQQTQTGSRSGNATNGRITGEKMSSGTWEGGRRSYQLQQEVA